MEHILLDRLSKFINEIKTLTEQALNICNILNDDNLEGAKVISAKLKTFLSRFTTELYNYFNICKTPDPDEISNFTTYQLQGEEALVELDTKLNVKTDQTKPSMKEAEPSTYSKLPDLHLPEFSGNLLEWFQFWDQFTSNINRRKLNDVDKLLYLKSSLKGEAARLVDGLDTTNKNYEFAVKTLKTRYGKKNELIHAHHRALNKIKQAGKLEECRSTLDDVERHLRVLTSMGENINTNQMKFLAMEKFPAELIYETKMRLGSGGTESVEEILKQLSVIISTKEEAWKITQNNSTGEMPQPQYTVETLHVENTSQQDKPSNLKKHQKQFNTFKPRNNHGHFKNRPDHQRNRPFKRKFEVKGEGNGKPYAMKRKKWSCIFCGENHFNDDCNKFKTSEERKTKLKGKCFNCFKSGHLVRNCNYKKNCAYCGKYGAHNKAICPDKIQMHQGGKSNKEATSVMHVGKKGSTVLQTAIVKVKGHGDITKTCRILCDSGSARSYITRAMATELNLQPEEQQNLAIFTFGSLSPKEIQSPLVKLGLVTRDNKVKTLFVNVVPTISQGVPYPKEELLDCKSKEMYQLADDGSLSDRIDILLGNDYYYTIMSTNKICIGEDLYIVESELGWILSGRISNKPAKQMSVVTYFQSSCEVGMNPPDPPLDNGDIKRLWDLESIGITDSPKLNRDEEAIKHFNKTTEFRDNRYYVSWPWNDSPMNLPTNFGLAFGRLNNLLKRLDPETLIVYDKTLQDQLEKGVIEEVPRGKEVDHPIHYIAHHGVSAPGKAIRIVYDCSAKSKDSKSLNEHLYCGPILLEDLTGLIMKFRCFAVGLTADVEKAFLQIGLKEPDRDVTRFLWLKDLKKPAKEDNLVHFRFTRVPFGVISSPFLLNATIKHHLSQAENENVRKLAHDIYVDNLVTGTNSTKEALDLYHNSKETFQQISMNLRQWSSNSKDFIKNIPDAIPDKIIKLLGLDWNLDEDTLHLRMKVVNSANTKRGVLKQVASVYDPCGYAVPTLLSAKLLLQDLWKMKIKWDSPLPKEIVDKWNDIKQDIDEIKNISLPRCYMKNPGDDCQIHCFTDSSTKAYAAVVYLVRKNEKSFVMGKSRLVPIKDQEHLKIPRLELLGVLIGSRLMKHVLNFITFPITKQILWTDSKIVIDWFNSNKLLTPFVSRRIEEIKRNKNLTIRYVPAELNPADVATRPITSKEDQNRWLSGPEFILYEPSSWPTDPNVDHILFTGEDLTKENENQEGSPEPMESEIISADVSQDTQSEKEDTTLKEIKKIQDEYFKDEVNGKVTSLSRNLGLFKDIDGILRCKGRFKYANWSFDKRYPMLIPKDCDFTYKVIREAHEKNYHVGPPHTLNIIREQYWIPQGKAQVTKVIKRCKKCLKQGGGPYKLPETPALPSERVNYSSAFTFTGVDYFGPMYVNTSSGNREKRWICLFTCLAVRAIHLEVVKDLTAEECLLAIRRFVANRGTPAAIISDNALQFKLTSEILINSYCVENKINWKFIPQLAPWHGGFYERLVGIVKHCLRRTLDKHLLNDSQLVTIIKEVEAVVNTRPLTSVGTDIEYVLRPADFLTLGKCLEMTPSDKMSDITGTATKMDLVQGWKKGQIMLAEFRKMFHQQYLPSLRERHRRFVKQPRVTSDKTPQLGDIVQIREELKNRNSWKVGKIISLIKGSDGLVRVAKVKVGDTIFTRSIGHLYPLEVEDSERQDPIEVPSNLKETRIPGVDIDVITGLDDVQKTLAYDETEKVDEMDMTDDIENVMNKELDRDIESIDIIQDHLKEDSVMIDKDLIEENIETVEEPAEEVKHKRQAAVRALEKIREWTQNLMVTLI